MSSRTPSISTSSQARSSTSRSNLRPDGSGESRSLENLEWSTVCDGIEAVVINDQHHVPPTSSMGVFTECQLPDLNELARVEIPYPLCGLQSLEFSLGSKDKVHIQMEVAAFPQKIFKLSHSTVVFEGLFKGVKGTQGNQARPRDIMGDGQQLEYPVKPESIKGETVIRTANAYIEVPLIHRGRRQPSSHVKAGIRIIANYTENGKYGVSECSREIWFRRVVKTPSSTRHSSAASRASKHSSHSHPSASSRNAKPHVLDSQEKKPTSRKSSNHKPEKPGRKGSVLSASTPAVSRKHERSTGSRGQSKRTSETRPPVSTSFMEALALYVDKGRTREKTPRRRGSTSKNNRPPSEFKGKSAPETSDDVRHEYVSEDEDRNSCKALVHIPRSMSPAADAPQDSVPFYGQGVEAENNHHPRQGKPGTQWNRGGFPTSYDGAFDERRSSSPKDESGSSAESDSDSYSGSDDESEAVSYPPRGESTTESHSHHLGDPFVAKTRGGRRVSPYKNPYDSYPQHSTLPSRARQNSPSPLPGQQQGQRH
ncbi:hypothetical protein T439DRAFT_323943 [Meredithblackwellia eburnea MCA 4105]